MAHKLAKLHIFLGAGGVGKTTLSASFALALAESGKKVGLISIDPAKRLQSALGVSAEGISDLGIEIPVSHSQGILRASVLNVQDCFMRWVTEQGLSEERKQELFNNPYFSALTEKIASSTDALAAIRISEWLDQYPDTEHLVVDTAPGLHAIEFISKPEKMLAFLDSKMLDWLKWFVGDGDKQKASFVARVMKTGARKILDGLVFIGGRGFLINFGEFLIMCDEVFIRAAERLKIAHQWLSSINTEIFIVTAVRDDAYTTARDLLLALKKLSLSRQQVIINRAFSSSLLQDENFLKFLSNYKYKMLQKNDLKDSLNDSSFLCKDLFMNYLFSYAQRQIQIREHCLSFALQVIELPIIANLDTAGILRLKDLSELGEKLLGDLK